MNLYRDTQENPTRLVDVTTTVHSHSVIVGLNINILN
jgi:hypothetical protein